MRVPSPRSIFGLVVRGRRGGDEAGFSLVETMLALGLVFTLLVGLLASLSTGVRGLLTGRQRTGATAVARQVVEEARSSDHDRVGHDLDDVTLADDPAVAGTAPDYTYTPEGETAESLVPATNPLYAVHEWAESRDGTGYTVRVYVTLASAGGDPVKRLTVVVSWARPQFDTAAVENAVRVSSFLADADPPGTTGSGGSGGDDEIDVPYTFGVVDVDTGFVSLEGDLDEADDLDLNGVDDLELDADVYFPTAHAEVEGRIIDVTRGAAASTRASLDVDDDDGAVTVSGCQAGGDDDEVECPGVSAETLADNDGGTAAPLRDAEGPLTDLGGELSAAPALTVQWGATNEVTSQSAAEACATCTPSIGDGDGSPYANDRALGPAFLQVDCVAGLLQGSLVRLGAGGSSTATVDVDQVSGGRRVTSRGSLEVPAVDLVTLTPAPPGYTTAASVTGLSVTAEAQAGPTALSPSVTGGPVAVQVYDTVLGAPAYRSITFDPGVDTVAETASVTFDVSGGALGLVRVSLETTVQAGGASTDVTRDGSEITRAEATLSNWFSIEVHLVVQQAGETVADFVIVLDYGRLAATAEYLP